MIRTFMTNRRTAGWAPRFVGTILPLVLATTTASGQGFEHQVVAKTGDAAPGTGLNFGVPGTASDPAGFGFAVINPAGGTAFLARVTGPGVTGNVNDIGIWARPAGGSLQLVARLGDVAPGTGGAVFAADASNGLGFPSIGANGAVGVRGFLGGTGVTTANDIALFTGQPGNIQLLAREGDVAPGTGGATYSTFSTDPQLWADGRYFFLGGLLNSPTTTNEGLFAGTPGNVHLLLRKGDVAPGAGGATFSSVSGFFASNPAGAYVIRGALVLGGSVTSANSAGAWGAPAGGGLQLLMRTGDTAPGIGTAITGIGTTTPLADGRFVVGITAAVGGSVTTANNTGIYVGTSQAAMQLAVRRGDQVPNAAPGIVLAATGIPVPGGDTFAFRTTVAGPGVDTTNNRALFTWNQADGLVMIARQLDVAPGTGGAQYGALGTPNPLGGGLLLTVGPTGVAAFVTPLVGSGVTTDNDIGIFAATPTGVLLVARKGDQIDLDPGPGVDLATIRNLGLSDALLANQVGQSGVSGAFEIAWHAEFTDGRYATFVSPVPEPSLALLVPAAALVGWRVRRRPA